MIRVECPWCGSVLAVDPDALDEPQRCDGCAVTFELGEADAAAELSQAA